MPEEGSIGHSFHASQRGFHPRGVRLERGRLSSDGLPQYASDTSLAKQTNGPKRNSAVSKISKWQFRCQVSKQKQEENLPGCSGFLRCCAPPPTSVGRRPHRFPNIDDAMSAVIAGHQLGNVSHMRGARPAYPGFLTQTYRLGDHLYSTGGSEAQRPPSTHTVRVQPYQWQTEHKREVSFSLAGQGLAATDRAAAFLTNANAHKGAKNAYERSTQMIANKMAATSKLKNELTAGSAAVQEELGLLHACMAATQAAIQAKKAPLEAVATFYNSRQTERVPTERLCDPVKHDLEVMTATLKESMRLLESALSAQQSEAMRLQVKKDGLDADASDKAAGLAIDTSAKGIGMPGGARPFTAPPPMAPISRANGLGSFPGATMHRLGMHVLHAPYDPVMWQSSSKAIADDARKVVAVSKRLRDTSEQLIRKRQAAELEVYTDL